MATYDSTDAVTPIPGDPNYSRTQAYTAPGTAPADEQEPAGVPTTISSVYGGPRVESVDPYDTGTPSQAVAYSGTEPISGVDLSGGSGAGAGRVHAPRGPGAGDHA